MSIKNWNRFILESAHKDNISILEEIASYSWIIEEEGFKIVYFVTFKLEDNQQRSKKDNLYTYALGSSYDIEDKIPSIYDGELRRVSLEIVNDIPRTIGYEKVLKQMEERGDLFTHMTRSFQIHLPQYKIYKSEGGPPYIDLLI